ncbi:hypothetical protein A4R43_01945 [Amycolatopsis albispora]|uniref:DUF4232 domain-containing protein n=1 Tax=Amycolatopsis albispora TaxID=1804986 RepID=A0A344L064_9PSEU|nr:hypothetical protein A4R43_01945 [Amycolatopsis albispora]
MAACEPATPSPERADVQVGETSATNPIAAPSCAADQLTGTLEPGSPGAGQRYATLVLTNKSGPACTVDGYGDLRLADADDTALPTDSWREPDPAPTPVVLAQGDAAQRELHWTVVRAPEEPADGPCQPEPERLEVTPPDRAGLIPVPWSFGPVCQHGWLGGGAYTAR